ncbi:OsmC family peroxiredoxin [Paludibacter sp. 221]|uniref:OsmC family protein n=1 Tax=Paludibacter sp. 221 TaxID=2302939 RepID=UPI0013D111D8|nr:OsmC family protein [Paludibacter sp. 221]NDV46052.1 OsmC family peroxiredoxin [Paludibacter sp. 221]
MTTHKITAEWKGNMAFEADIDGHKIMMDASVESGGDSTGASPKKLMLSALAGCTGMDVVSILKKMRVPVEKCTIEVQGNVTEEHPKQYETMHLVFEFTGKNLPLDKIQKAVKMSEETYCGVGAFYRKVIDITTEIRIKES